MSQPVHAGMYRRMYFCAGCRTASAMAVNVYVAAHEFKIRVLSHVLMWLKTNGRGERI
jgi:hypothetical protein